MILGVFSDSHNRITTAVVALQAFKDAEVQLVIHCGDWTNLDSAFLLADVSKSFGFSVYGVLGNNDELLRTALQRHPSPFENMYISPDDVFELQIEDLHVCVYHGHDNQLLKTLQEIQEYDVIFTGHTHKPGQKQVGKTLVINPGSSAFSMPGRSSRTATAALFNTDTKETEIFPLIQADSQVAYDNLLT